jgi:serine/threonine-protein kinase HipA
MNLLHVWITLPRGETIALGQLAFGDLRTDGTAPTAFRYDPSWLARPDAFSLNPDPQSLPLDLREFAGSHLGPPLQVFDDAMPDDWGKRLIAAENRLPMTRQTPYWFLLAVAGGGLGALSFSEKPRPPKRAPTATDLADLIQAAEDFDAGRPVEGLRLRRLYAAGATPGGARPKALISADGHEWIAKLPSPTRDNGHDVVGLEAASLVLAGRAGLSVPESKLIELGQRRALLVRRFDVTAAGGRRHIISLKTLCAERGGVFATTYDEPMGAIRRYASDPADVARFFRQMTFNAALGNTDDHLKNFAMLHDEQGWWLSPAFDLTPDVGRNREHTLAIGYSRDTPSGGTLTDIGERWLGRRALAQSIVQEVIEAVSGFRSTAEQLGVAAHSVGFFQADIERRLETLRRQR